MLQNLRRHLTRALDIQAIDNLDDPSGFPGLAQLDPRRLEFQLFIFPAFDPYVSWSIFSNDEESWSVRRIAWNHREDFQIIVGGPTIYAADAKIPVGVASALLSELKAIKVPSFNFPSTLGIDGVSHTVRRESSYHSSEVSWWCDAPQGWEDLESWYHRTLPFLDRFLPERTV